MIRTSSVFQANRNGGFALLTAHTNGFVIEYATYFAFRAWLSMARGFTYLIDTCQMRWTSGIWTASIFFARTRQFSGGIDHQLVFTLTRGFMKACHAFLIGSAYGCVSTRRFAHANIGFAVGVLRTVIVTCALHPNNRWGRTSAVRVEFASNEGTSSVTFGTSTSWSMVDDVAKSVGTTSSSEWAWIFTFSTNAGFVDGAVGIRCAYFV